MNLNETAEVHKTLNPKLWNNKNILHDDVRQKLLEIIEEFVSTCEGVPLNIADARIVGSNASFNYTQYSDLDVHLICNFELLDASKEIVQCLYDALKAKFNLNYDITIHDIPVELYVEDIRSSVMSNGVYSIYEDAWIKFPTPQQIKQIDVSDEVSQWINRFDKIIKQSDADQVTEFINDLYLLRKNSLEADGEYSAGNQVFKEVRNQGILDKAKDAYKEFRSKELTLEHLALTEASRSSILSKSKQTQKGLQRFKRRVKSRVANTVKQYNNIDMNKLFKDDILTMDVQVKGETDTYLVKISFGGFLDILYDQIKTTQQLNLKAITRALITGFNRDDVYIRCSCADSQYRFQYWQSKNNMIAGDKETRPSNITNPDDNLGAACKHVLLVLSNTSFLLRVGSTIFNYINYMEKHYDRLYKKVIYPAIWKKQYEEPEQLEIDGVNSDELATDTDTIDQSNTYARTKNQFKQGNEYRFTPGEDKDQISIDELDDTET